MLATSLAQAQAMWKLRESVPEAQRRHGPSIKHDVSVPVSAIPELIEKAMRWHSSSPPKGTWSPTGTRATAICISI